MAGVLDDLLDGTVTLVSGLGLDLNATSIPVRKRKLPRIAERVEEAPCIFVCASERQGPQRPFATAGEDGIPTKRVENRIQVTAIIPGNGDNQTNVGVYPGWMEQIAALFGNQQVYQRDDVLMIRVVPEVHIDRRAFALLYDYLALELRVTTVNPAYS